MIMGNCFLNICKQHKHLNNMYICKENKHVNKMNENEKYFLSDLYLHVSTCINLVEFRVLLTSTIMIGL